MLLFDGEYVICGNFVESLLQMQLKNYSNFMVICMMYIFWTVIFTHCSELYLKLTYVYLLGDKWERRKEQLSIV